MSNIWPIVQDTIQSLGIICLVLIGLLLSIAYLTYIERKIIAAIQLRRGPSLVGPFGLMQPFADGLKLFFKESIIPAKADTFLFIFAPILIFSLSLAAWAVIPIDYRLVLSNIHVGILYFLAIASTNVYGIIIAGWASHSSYAFLGALRSAAQMISYEISMGLVIVSVLLLSRSTNLQDIVLAQKGCWFIIPLFPMGIIFFIAALAETNRSPFDIPEAETELIAGYHVEYSSLPFALFFLSEYANMILMSAMMTILFCGGWLPIMNIAPFTWIPGFLWFFLKTSFFVFTFIWVRATLPRYRYDQLMHLGWKVFLPLSLVWIMGTSATMMILGEAR